ncbi:methyltransferase CmcJ [Podospora didyma]|uniref:Methyltransferase CmcJ n=1 Tax=Podospora didyma TaxID=330526 RepID=A0AAE0K265_9PEZI|nr:methyltransferase CmcJ [Podospora didyma]
MACGTVTAELQYLKRLPLYQKEKPFQLFVPVDEDATDPRTTNIEFETKEQTFVDIRDRLSEFSLDSHGFQVNVHPTGLDLASFANRETVETKYFAEVEQILKTIEGGYDKVFIFDWRVRNSATPKESVIFDMNDLTTWLRPSPNVHVDQSPRGVLHRIQLHLPDEAAFLLQGRVRVVNVWRPLENVVEDYPLAFCDPDSVSGDDLVECDHVRRKFKGSNMYAHYDPDHKWYYLGQQRPEEALLLKMFDSEPDVKAKMCPHASFHHPLSTPQSKPRKSIEVRALVFNYPDQPMSP